ncbi:uncharacterized protein LOC129740929 [Uranotaenia lowii]|uniref:uncharacterized protein LOC129740929 n=1 Tax=Uranotaenia lowii TaxID=190385 RepID=UPI00247AA50B|nr:uncharacterized protein LOC129740929 [Uranotaenia lowii]
MDTSSTNPQGTGRSIKQESHSGELGIGGDAVVDQSPGKTTALSPLKAKLLNRDSSTEHVQAIPPAASTESAQSPPVSTETTNTTPSLTAAPMPARECPPKSSEDSSTSQTGPKAGPSLFRRKKAIPSVIAKKFIKQEKNRPSVVPSIDSIKPKDEILEQNPPSQQDVTPLIGKPEQPQSTTTDDAKPAVVEKVAEEQVNERSSDVEVCKEDTKPNTPVVFRRIKPKVSINLNQTRPTKSILKKPNPSKPPADLIPVATIDLLEDDEDDTCQEEQSRVKPNEDNGSTHGETTAAAEEEEKSMIARRKLEEEKRRSIEQEIRKVEEKEISDKNAATTNQEPSASAQKSQLQHLNSKKKPHEQKKTDAEQQTPGIAKVIKPSQIKKCMKIPPEVWKRQLNRSKPNQNLNPVAPDSESNTDKKDLETSYTDEKPNCALVEASKEVVGVVNPEPLTNPEESAKAVLADKEMPAANNGTRQIRRISKLPPSLAMKLMSSVAAGSAKKDHTSVKHTSNTQEPVACEPTEPISKTLVERELPKELNPSPEKAVVTKVADESLHEKVDKLTLGVENEQHAVQEKEISATLDRLEIKETPVKPLTENVKQPCTKEIRKIARLPPNVALKLLGKIGQLKKCKEAIVSVPSKSLGKDISEDLKQAVPIPIQEMKPEPDEPQTVAPENVPVIKPDNVQEQKPTVGQTKEIRRISKLPKDVAFQLMKSLKKSKPQSTPTAKLTVPLPLPEIKQESVEPPRHLKQKVKILSQVILPTASYDLEKLLAGKSSEGFTSIPSGKMPLPLPMPFRIQKVESSIVAEEESKMAVKESIKGDEENRYRIVSDSIQRSEATEEVTYAQEHPQSQTVELECNDKSLDNESIHDNAVNKDDHFDSDPKVPTIQDEKPVMINEDKIQLADKETVQYAENSREDTIANSIGFNNITQEMTSKNEALQRDPVVEVCNDVEKVHEPSYEHAVEKSQNAPVEQVQQQTPPKERNIQSNQNREIPSSFPSRNDDRTPIDRVSIQITENPVEVNRCTENSPVEQTQVTQAPQVLMVPSSSTAENLMPSNTVSYHPIYSAGQIHPFTILARSSSNRTAEALAKDSIALPPHWLLVKTTSPQKNKSTALQLQRMEHPRQSLQPHQQSTYNPQLQSYKPQLQQRISQHPRLNPPQTVQHIAEQPVRQQFHTSQTSPRTAQGLRLQIYPHELKVPRYVQPHPQVQPSLDQFQQHPGHQLQPQNTQQIPSHLTQPYIEQNQRNNPFPQQRNNQHLKHLPSSSLEMYRPQHVPHQTQPIPGFQTIRHPQAVNNLVHHSSDRLELHRSAQHNEHQFTISQSQQIPVYQSKPPRDIIHVSVQQNQNLQSRDKFPLPPYEHVRFSALEQQRISAHEQQLASNQHRQYQPPPQIARPTPQKPHLATITAQTARYAQPPQSRHHLMVPQTYYPQRPASSQVGNHTAQIVNKSSSNIQDVHIARTMHQSKRDAAPHFTLRTNKERAFQPVDPVPTTPSIAQQAQLPVPSIRAIPKIVIDSSLVENDPPKVSVDSSFNTPDDGPDDLMNDLKDFSPCSQMIKNKLREKVQERMLKKKYSISNQTAKQPSKEPTALGSNYPNPQMVKPEFPVQASSNANDGVVYHVAGFKSQTNHLPPQANKSTKDQALRQYSYGQQKIYLTKISVIKPIKVEEQQSSDNLPRAGVYQRQQNFFHGYPQSALKTEHRDLQRFRRAVEQLEKTSTASSDEHPVTSQKHRQKFKRRRSVVTSGPEMFIITELPEEPTAGPSGSEAAPACIQQTDTLMVEASEAPVKKEDKVVSRISIRRNTFVLDDSDCEIKPDELPHVDERLDTEFTESCSENESKISVKKEHSSNFSNTLLASVKDESLEDSDELSDEDLARQILKLVQKEKHSLKPVKRKKKLKKRRKRKKPSPKRDDKDQLLDLLMKHVNKDALIEDIVASQRRELSIIELSDSEEQNVSVKLEQKPRVHHEKSNWKTVKPLNLDDDSIEEFDLDDEDENDIFAEILKPFTKAAESSDMRQPAVSDTVDNSSDKTVNTAVNVFEFKETAEKQVIDDSKELNSEDNNFHETVRTVEHTAVFGKTPQNKVIALSGNKETTLNESQKAIDDEAPSEIPNEVVNVNPFDVQICDKNPYQMDVEAIKKDSADAPRAVKRNAKPTLVARKKFGRANEKPICERQIVSMNVDCTIMSGVDDLKDEIDSAPTELILGESVQLSQVEKGANSYRDEYPDAVADISEQTGQTNNCENQIVPMKVECTSMLDVEAPIGDIAPATMDKPIQLEQTEKEDSSKETKIKESVHAPKARKRNSRPTLVVRKKVSKAKKPVCKKQLVSKTVDYTLTPHVDSQKDHVSSVPTEFIKYKPVQPNEPDVEDSSDPFSDRDENPTPGDETESSTMNAVQQTVRKIVEDWDSDENSQNHSTPLVEKPCRILKRDVAQSSLPDDSTELHKIDRKKVDQVESHIFNPLAENTEPSLTNVTDRESDLVVPRVTVRKEDFAEHDPKTVGDCDVCQDTTGSVSLETKGSEKFVDSILRDWDSPRKIVPATNESKVSGAVVQTIDIPMSNTPTPETIKSSMSVRILLERVKLKDYEPTKQKSNKKSVSFMDTSPGKAANDSVEDKIVNRSLRSKNSCLGSSNEIIPQSCGKTLESSDLLDAESKPTPIKKRLRSSGAPLAEQQTLPTVSNAKRTRRDRSKSIGLEEPKAVQEVTKEAQQSTGRVLRNRTKSVYAEMSPLQRENVPAITCDDVETKMQETKPPEGIRGSSDKVEQAGVVADDARTNVSEPVVKPSPSQIIYNRIPIPISSDSDDDAPLAKRRKKLRKRRSTARSCAVRNLDVNRRLFRNDSQSKSTSFTGEIGFVQPLCDFIKTEPADTEEAYSGYSSNHLSTSLVLLHDSLADSDYSCSEEVLSRAHNESVSVAPTLESEHVFATPEPISKQRKRRTKEQIEQDKMSKKPRKTEPLTPKGEKVTVNPADNDVVTCASCFKVLPQKEWNDHYFLHNGLTYRKGIDAPVDLDDTNTACSIMIKFMKAFKLHAVTCDRCGVSKKSAMGLISHRATCGLSAEEALKSKVSCQHCNRRLLPVSMATHLLSHCPVLKQQQKKGQEENEAEDDPYGEDFEVLNQSGRVKRKATAKAEQRISKLSCDDLIRPITKQTVTPGCLSQWKAQMRKAKSAKCVFTTCDFVGCNEAEMRLHHEFCPSNSEKFECKQCFYQASPVDVLVRHIKRKHGDLLVNPFECSGSEANIDSESSDDDNSPLWSSHGETTDGERVKTPKPRKSISKASPKSTAVAKDFAQEESDVYREMVAEEILEMRSLRGGFYAQALIWTKEFRKRHYSPTMLFKNFQPDIDMGFLSKTLVTDYIPKSARSMRFIIRSTNLYNAPLQVHEYADKWQQIDTFKGIARESDSILYCGGPVVAMDWLPIEDERQEHEVLAVACKSEFNEFYLADRIFPSKCIIQLWDIGYLNNRTLKKSSNSEPMLMYSIACDFGPIWSLKFCPSGCYNSEEDEKDYDRLGLLAAACSDGDIRIFSLAPSYEVTNRYRIVNLKPMLILTLNMSKNPTSNQYEGHSAVKLVWSKGKGHSVVAAGFSNGAIGVWDLNTKSSLLLGSKHSSPALLPFRRIYLPDSCITALDLHYAENTRYLLACNADRKLAVYDLHTEYSPQEVCTMIAKSKVTSASWSIHFPVISMVFDDVFAIDRCALTLHQTREIGIRLHPLYTFGAEATSMSENDWISTHLVATDGGDVLCHRPLGYIYQLTHKNYQVHKYILSSTISAKITDEPTDTSYAGFSSNFGLVFTDNDKSNAKMDIQSLQVKSHRRAIFHEYPGIRINQVCWNPNRKAHLNYAIGYQTGFVRVRTFKLKSEGGPI